MKKSVVFLGFLLIVFSGLNLWGQNPNSEYNIINRIKLPGTGSWDYLTVDEAGGRLFLSHATELSLIRE